MGHNTDRPVSRLALLILIAAALMALAVLAGLRFHNMGGSDAAGAFLLQGIDVS